MSEPDGPCRECGARVTGGAVYCARCGSRQRGAPEGIPWWKLLLAVVVGLVAIPIAVAFAAVAGFWGACMVPEPGSGSGGQYSFNPVAGIAFAAVAGIGTLAAGIAIIAALLRS